MDVRAKLGFHAPYIERQDLDGLPIDGSALVDAYIAANAAIGTLVDIPRSVGDEDRSIVPIRLLADMLKRGPKDFASVDTIDTALRWGIDLTGYEIPHSITKANLCNACGADKNDAALGNIIDCNFPEVTYRQNKNQATLIVPGEGAEGLYSCVAVATLDSGQPTGLKVGLVESPESGPVQYSPDDLSEAPLWHLYPRTAPIAELAAPN